MSSSARDAGPNKHLMVRAACQRAGMRREAGFSMVELMIVVLIIGLLAAIVLPLFVSQTEKGADVDAKHGARNVAGALEGCNALEEDYRSCTSASRLRDTGVPIGSAAGQVEVDAPTARTYTVTAHSRSGTDFTMSRLSGGGQERTCSRRGLGGCPPSGEW